MALKERNEYERVKPGRRRRLFLVGAAVLLVVAAGFLAAPRVRDYAHCQQTGSIWYEGGECVGVSADGYSFDRSFDAVTRAIADENRLVEQGGIPSSGRGTSCTSTAKTSVAVAALGPWRALLSGTRAVRELEGMYVAQWRANHLGEPGGCQPYIRLLVANTGRDTQAWESVVDDIAGRVNGDDHLVAVVGLGLSKTQTAYAARRLTDPHHIPMVADLVTAVGFDKSNFATVPRACMAGLEGSGRIEGFRRVSFDNGRQIAGLVSYLRDQRAWSKDSVLQVTQAGYETDPYACTGVALANKEISPSGPAREPQTFKLSDDGRDAEGYLQRVVNTVCGNPSITTVLYTARGLDLATLLKGLSQQCTRPITVASTSDASRLRVPEAVAPREVKRKEGLAALQGGRLRLVYAPLAAPEVLGGSEPFEAFKRQFTKLGFAADDLADGWAVVGHDAVFTIATAIHQVDQNRSGGDSRLPAMDEVAANLGGVTVENAAEGTLTFDENGNRVDDPTIIRLCADGTAYPVARATRCAGDN
jgi:hypothetical protein